MSLPSRRNMEIALGALFAVSLVILGYMALRMGAFASLADTVTVQVRLPDASGLVENAAIKVAGVDVGQVSDLRVDFDEAVADLRLRRDAGIRKDAVALVKARSLLGEKYIELEPRSREAPLAEDGDQLAAAPQPLAIEDLAGVLGPLVRDLDVEQISDAVVRVLAMIERQEAPLSSILARADRMLARLETLPVDDPQLHADLKATLHHLRVASEGLPELSDQAATTLKSGQALATSLQPAATALNRGSEEIPEMMERLSSSLARLDRVLATLEPQVARLEELDYNDIRYLFRQEGLLVRWRPVDVPGMDVPFEPLPEGEDETPPPALRPVPEGPLPPAGVSRGP